jgi:hypothetical protein
MRIRAFALTLAVLAAGLPAVAAGRFTLSGGYALTGNAKIGNGGVVGFAAGFEIARSLSLDFAASGLLASNESDPVGLSAGSLLLVPVEAGLTGRFKLGSFLALFAGIRAGVALPFHTLDSGLVKSWTAIGFSLEEKLGLALTASARLGLEAALTKGTWAILEAGYRLCRANGTWRISDDLGSESVDGTMKGVNLDSFFVGLGLSFAFGR